MEKENLINDIRTAFKDVKLEDGIGLWEGQGCDDYADPKTMADLKRKDERNNWDAISYKDLSLCSSSLSFFDAKGMRFCLPKFLLFDLLEEEIFREEQVDAPDVLFTLCYDLQSDYQLHRFSLLNQQQVIAVIHFLEYKLAEVVAKHDEYAAQYGSNNTEQSDEKYIEINAAIAEWKKKLN